jgi:hypothetical protein
MFNIGKRMIPLFKNDLINRFWFESNAAWGYCENYQDLREKIQLVIEGHSGLDTIEEVLNKAKHNPRTISIKKIPGEDPVYEYLKDGSDFGLRGEHSGDLSLKQFLVDIGHYDSFMEYWNAQELHKQYGL